MADGMFGAPVGIGAFEQDALRRATTQHTLGEVAMQPDVGRLRKAQADALELENQQNKTFAQLMVTAMGGQTVSPEEAAGLGVPAKAAPSINTSGSLTSQFDTLARIAAQSGLVTKAQEMAKTSALIKAREASERNSTAQAALNRLKGIAAQAETSAQIFGGAKDEASWAQAQDLFEFQTGQPSPFRDVPYSADLVKRINDSAITAKERADLADKAATRADVKRYRDARLADFDLDRDVKKDRNRIAEAREERLRKLGGGKAATAPNATELSQLKRMITKDFPEFGVDAASADLNDAAFSIASEAKAMQKANPALSSAAAMAQAYSNAVQAGDFQVDKVLLGRNKGRFSGRGRTAATATPVPMAGGKVDASKLSKDRYYIGQGGVLGRWTGKGFELVTGSGRPLSSDNSDPDDDLLEDDDDE